MSARNPSRYTPPPRAFCRAELVTRLLRSRARTFLDIGCGEGYIAERLAKMGLTGLALDASPEAVAIARQRLQSQALAGVKVRHGDLFDVEVPRGEADAVLFLEVLEHLEDDMAALERLRQLVRDGGFLVVSVPAHARLWDALDDWAGHLRRYERDELREKLKRSGWEPIVIYNYGFPLINFTRRLRALFYSRLNRRSGPVSQKHATLRSGLHGDDSVSRFRWPLAAYGRLASLLQRPFLRTDLGEAYLVLAEKLPLPGEGQRYRRD
jgi:SAM-dependent methyltransferase